MTNSPRFLQTIIPVIDLLNGEVVRGVGGRRHEYRAIESVWVDSAEPGPVAQMFAKTFGFNRAYVADLDAIAGREPNWSAFAEIAAADVRFLLDAGIADAAAADRILARVPALDGLVLGLESSPSAAMLNSAFTAAGAKRAVFSLDLRQGVAMSTSAEWQSQTPRQIVDTVINIGFQRLIVLDLASVGEALGPSVLDLCRDIRHAHPTIELISGGGVRNLNDVQAFHEAGCDGVLVATALHNGHIRPSVC